MTSLTSNRSNNSSPLPLLSAALLATLCCSLPTLAATPSTQTAIVQHGTGGPDVLKLESIPVLSPDKGEVLIRVYAAAINPVASTAAKNALPAKRMRFRLPLVASLG